MSKPQNLEYKPVIGYLIVPQWSCDRFIPFVVLGGDSGGSIMWPTGSCPLGHQARFSETWQQPLNECASLGNQQAGQVGASALHQDLEARMLNSSKYSRIRFSKNHKSQWCLLAVRVIAKTLAGIQHGLHSKHNETTQQAICCVLRIC